MLKNEIVYFFERPFQTAVLVDSRGWQILSPTFWSFQVMAGCENPGDCIGGCVGNDQHYNIVT